MKLPIALLNIALWLAATASAQQATTCTSDLVVTDDCTDVMNPIACYNQYRWNTRTLSCIEGTNDTERKRKACKCCSCIGTVMCNWVKTQKYC
ncbi:hypothetical protein GE09DRAFT_1218597 [Coniochaeta sp. 2T2.1]|nr:hypothetical protein GE09DRAFT_1218597 [Coniochaeta sp. 2T2.1]